MAGCRLIRIEGLYPFQNGFDGFAEWFEFVGKYGMGGMVVVQAIQKRQHGEYEIPMVGAFATDCCILTHVSVNHDVSVMGGVA